MRFYLRYLDWRDQRSSSRTLGFRIEGTYQDSQAKKDFKSVKSQEDVTRDRCPLLLYFSTMYVTKYKDTWVST